MDLIHTGHSALERRQKGDLRREILKLVDEADGKGIPVRWGDIATRLSDQSTVPVEPVAFAEAMRVLESEGLFIVSGEGPRRIIRRVAGATM